MMPRLRIVLRFVIISLIIPGPQFVPQAGFVLRLPGAPSWIGRTLGRGGRRGVGSFSALTPGFPPRSPPETFQIRLKWPVQTVELPLARTRGVGHLSGAEVRKDL